MHNYQLIIQYKEQPKTIYKLTTPEEIMLGFSLQLITRNGIILRDKEKTQGIKFPHGYSPFRLETEYISLRKSLSYYCIPRPPKLDDDALQQIDKLIGLDSEIHIELLVNDFKVVPFTADYLDMASAENVINQLNSHFSKFKAIKRSQSTSTIARVSYYEQLKNSGLLEKYSSLKKDTILPSRMFPPKNLPEPIRFPSYRHAHW